MSSDWKIYTKTGDTGKTSLIGGTRVPKYDVRIEAYGTVDELNAWIGLIRDQQINDHYREVLLEIEDRLFTLESELATGPEKIDRKLPEIIENDILLLEKEIDQMNEALPELTSFILPGGHSTVSYCHLARTVCRRSERKALKMSESFPVKPTNIKYLNRLSDYLFVLSRKLALDLGASETLWKPRF
jgi:cob(I)alamin adenosyltransferase